MLAVGPGKASLAPNSQAWNMIPRLALSGSLQPSRNIGARALGAQLLSSRTGAGSHDP